MKVTVIGGAGNVGATCAQILANKEVVEEIWLCDVAEGVAKGKGLDMYESMPIFNASTKIFGTKDYADTANSDIIVITAGIARKPGMSRDDLLKINSGIVSSCAEQAVKYSPNAFFVIVSNPLDVMTYVAIQKTKLPRNKVIGMAGILDTARYRTFLSMELGISVKDIHALVLGGHGDTMVPLPRYTTVNGIPVTDLIEKDKLDAICERTANGGGEIVKYLQTGSAWYAPGTAAAQIVEAIVKNQKRLLPCTVLLDGEYGYKNVCVGVPIIIGKNGVEKIVELKLDKDEKALFDKSAQHVEKTIKEAMELVG
ncbi:MAG: malate dehydrogenase [Bacteroidetes bacterium]|nr:malate dehydrogenase [Bacteroidota bacterium]MBR3090717.1 malate dehydrogenase [Bacteroidota bacterium]